MPLLWALQERPAGPLAEVLAMSLLGGRGCHRNNDCGAPVVFFKNLRLDAFSSSVANLKMIERHKVASTRIDT
jgi:hypothetical protein